MDMLATAACHPEAELPARISKETPSTCRSCDKQLPSTMRTCPQCWFAETSAMMKLGRLHGRKKNQQQTDDDTQGTSTSAAPSKSASPTMEPPIALKRRPQEQDEAKRMRVALPPLEPLESLGGTRSPAGDTSMPPITPTTEGFVAPVAKRVCLGGSFAPSFVP